MNKLTEKFAKVDESFTVYRYDNGFMFEIRGRDHDNEWRTSKILSTTQEDLLNLIKQAVSLPLDE
jgi:hypothetical protein